MVHVGITADEKVVAKCLNKLTGIARRARRLSAEVESVKVSEVSPFVAVRDREAMLARVPTSKYVMRDYEMRYTNAVEYRAFLESKAAGLDFEFKRVLHRLERIGFQQKSSEIGDAGSSHTGVVQ